ncbi:unnamed protein product [marine sediment metagenome]|uniref:Uncharacterized protein n=1 Tax=marine sediment metagenome TaxID=412755 RepID=X1LZP3_9ZZZZ
MKAAHKRYDSKWKVTRILLADYLLLKQISQAADVSMAEALHKIITRDWAMAQSTIKAKAPVVSPVTAPVVLPVTAPVAYRSGPITALATNGSKGAAFRIKPKGASYD